MLLISNYNKQLKILNLFRYQYLIVTIVIVACCSISLCLMKLLMKIVVIKRFMREQHNHLSRQYSTGNYLV